MKRAIALWIALLLMGVICFGCTKPEDESEEPLPEGPDETPTYSVNFGEQSGVFIDVRERYAAGDEVVLKTDLVMDATPTVTADGEKLSPRVSEDGRYLLYTFLMPAHDVRVTYSISGSDMERQFTIAYEGDTMRVIDPIYAAFPRETVTVKLGLIFDVITDVCVNGKNASQVDGPDDGYLYFEFEMPEEDVVVEIESRNISAVAGEPIMMVDYYESAVATADEGDSYEIVLYDDQMEQLLLVEYRKDGSEVRYRVPQDVLIEALNVIYGAKMDWWNDWEDMTSIDGALYVCQFNEGGYYYRVSSERMPEDGMDAFIALKTLLMGYLTEENRE